MTTSYALSEQVRRVLKAEKIAEEELLTMVQLAAPYTGEGMNRRYHQWLFLVENTTVQKMMLQDLRTVGKVGSKGWVEEEHDACVGEGCRDCGWSGIVRRYL
jgi:hypothetical protein